MDEMQILDGVARTFGTTTDRLLTHCKDVRLVEARKVAYYLLRELTDLTTTEIGHFLHRDHSTVIQGAHAIERRMKTSVPYAQTIQRLKAALWADRACLA